MAGYTITPWRTPADLINIRTHLYPSHFSPTQPDQRRYAVDRIQAWKIRGNLPHAIESTALLTDAILHHSSQETSSFSIRAVYSAAFCRFVTGFCDIGRSRERTLSGTDGGQSSMLEIARQIGMPSEFVSLRHEATHDELPSTRRMKTAVMEGLDWLWEVYWSKLEDPTSVDYTGVEDLEQRKVEMRRLLKEFRKFRKDALRTRTETSEAHHEQVHAYATALEALFKGSVAQMKALAELLVEEKFLFPSKRRIGSSMEGAFALWDTLLSSLQLLSPGFSETLVNQFLHTLSSDSATDHKDEAESESIYLWTLHIIASLQARPVRRNLMQWCCLHPGQWTQLLGEHLLRDADKDDEFEWQDLFEASKLQAVADTQEAADAAKTEDVLVLDHGCSDLGSSDEALEVDGGWRKAPLSPRGAIGVVS